MTDFQVFMPIAKLDKKRRTVSGYASTPTKDGDGEIITLEAIRDALPGYMEYANIREMHKLHAVGVAEEANIDTKGLYVTAKIVDDAAWEKCAEGVYKGFSIGGKKLDKQGNKITAVDLTEISVVDRPCNPDCRISIAKAAKINDGATDGGHLVEIKTPESEAERVLRKALKKLAKKGPPAAHDGFSLPAKTAKAEIGPNDSRPNENATRKTEGPELCAAHGKADCAECAPAAAPKKAKKNKKALKALGLKKLLSIDNGALELRKGMGTVGTLSYTFDSIRGAQRSLMSEAQREGGDMKDKKLATDLGEIASRLANVISLKAEHEGEEARNFTDADDMYLSSLLGEDFAMTTKAATVQRTGDPLTDAMAALMKRAAEPSLDARMSKAKEDVKEARKAAKEARKAVADCHKMLKAAYIAKMAKAKGGKKPTEDGDEDDFDSMGAMGKLQKAFSEIEKARTFGKAASEQISKAMAGRSGQRGQEVSDGNAHYTVPGGIKDLSPSDLATASPGGEGGGKAPELMPSDGSVYAGKAAGADDLRKFAGAGGISPEMMDVLIAKAKAETELDILKRMPTNGGSGQRPFAFDVTQISGMTAGGNDKAALNKALFSGVDPNALSSTDERARTAATAKVLGNYLTQANLGKSVFDPGFHGAAGSKA